MSTVRPSVSSLPKVAIFTSSEGHLSIAQSIEHALAAEYQTVTYFKRDSLMSGYVFLYQFFPFSYKIPFVLAKQKDIAKAFHEFLKKRYLQEIRKFIQKHNPAVCINTFYVYNNCLAIVCAELNIPLLNVATDPRTIHPLILEPRATTNFVFDQQSVKDATQMLPNIRVTESGWFIRPEFKPANNKKAVRESLGLNQEIFTLLLSAGSEGTNYITKIMPSLINSPKPLQIVVLCGNNKNLLSSLQATRKVVGRFNSNIHLHIVGYTHEMHRYLQAADLVVGKAGPNTIFETVATEVPFFAITHIAGQEDGNLEIIEQYKLGYVEENPFKGGKILDRIIQHPHELEKFQAPLKSFAQMLKKSPEILKDTVRTALETSPTS